MSEEVSKYFVAKSDKGILKSLGNFIKETRLSQGKTQDNLAKESGLNRTTLIQMERGNGGNLLSFIQVIRALDRLEIFQIFEIQNEISPMLLAKEDALKLRRAPRSTSKKPLEPLDW